MTTFGASARYMSNGHGPSFSNGPGDELRGGPPVTITGVQLGRPGDDRFGG
jgi:hypothetical protein